MNAKEEAEYQAWLAADRRHAAAVNGLQSTWSRMNQLRSVGRGGDLRREVERIVARKSRRRLAVGFTGLAAAAAIVFGFILSRPNTESEPILPSIVVRPDGRLLPDGSRVELNLGTDIAIDFSAEIRGVRLLRGEALFHVAKDSTRPFIVAAGHVAVRAVGTAFAVRLEPTAVDVLVTEGEVAVVPTAPPPSSDQVRPSATEIPAVMDAPAVKPVFASAGNRLVVPAEPTPTTSLAPQRISAREIAAALAWRNRRVEFNGTSLAEAVAIFNRENSIQLSVANPETGGIRITGVFWTNDPEAFSRVVETSLGVTAQQGSDGSITFHK